MRDRRREPRQHERESLCNAARVDSRAVQGHPTGERSVGNRFVARVARVRVYPADRGDNVLAGPQDGDDLFVIGHQRAVHDAVGIQGKQLIEAGGGGDAKCTGSDDVTDVETILVGAVYPASGQLELRVIHHARDCGFADASGRPLDDTKFARATHR